MHQDKMTALMHIFRCLPVKDRARAACVSKEWNHVAQHPSLYETLDLRNSQEAGAWLSRLLGSDAAVTRQLYQQHLRHVNLEFAAGVDDENLAALHNCSLETLNLNACQRVTDAGLAPLLVSSPNLRSLGLYWNLHVSDSTLFGVAASCPDLEVVSLSGCKAVTDTGVRTMAKGCPKLVDLDLTRCVLVTDSGFGAAATACQQLQVLRLYACSAVTDIALGPISNLKQLQVLDVTGAIGVTDAGVSLLGQCSQLRIVVLTWCIQLMDAGVLPIARGCSHLELLSLHGIRGITSRTIEALAASCKGSLHTLDVNGCSGIVDRSRDALSAVLPNLHTFVVHT